MSKNIESLWPSLAEIKLPEEIAPVILLQEQAAAIGEETHYIIEGQIITEKAYYDSRKPQRNLSTLFSPKQVIDYPNLLPSILIEDDNYICHSLFIRSPIIPGYKYRILSIIHRNTQIYPVRITSEIDNIKIIDTELSNPQELTDSFRIILRSEPVQSVLSSLLAQSGYQQAA